MTHPQAPAGLGGRRNAFATAVSVLLIAALGACSDDDATASSDPTDGSTSSEPGPTTGAPTTSAPTTPSAEPAAGPQLVQDHIEANMPEGWELDKRQASFQASGHAPGTTFSQMYLSTFPTLNPDQSLADVARSTNKTGFGGRGKILAPTTVSGVRVGHVKGIYFGSQQEEWVTLVGGDIVSLQLSLERATSPAVRQKITESVLASVEWTD